MTGCDKGPTTASSPTPAAAPAAPTPADQKKSLETFLSTAIPRWQSIRNRKMQQDGITVDKVSVLSIDIQKRDSLLNPIVGVVNVREYISFHGTPSMEDDIVYELSPQGTTWKLVRVVQEGKEMKPEWTES